MLNNTAKPFRIRSYVPRGRRTEAQERAHTALWPEMGLEIASGLLDAEKAFGRVAPLAIEIGFGSGHSLLALAKEKPEHNFIGVETHQPGIGALMMGIKEHGLTNLRAYYGDVIDVLTDCMPNGSIDCVQIFFPDPWQKRRHRERRLIQPDFIRLVVDKLKPGSGQLHLATDWDDYAKHMMVVLSSEQQLQNLEGVGCYASRSLQRPIVTKFEARAIREGRNIWEMQFRRI